MADLSEQIEDNAKQPWRAVAADGRSATQHTLKDQIEADQYLATREKLRNGKLGLRFATLKPPGAA